MPHRDGDLAKWEENFNTKLTTYAPSVGVLPTEVTVVSDVIHAHAASFSDMVSAKDTAKSKVAGNNQKKKGMREIVRPLVQRIKNHPGYTDEIGKDLGIIGPVSTVDIMASRPVIKVHSGANGVTVDFNKSEFDGVKIFSKRGSETEFTFLANDTNPPYLDTRDNLNKAPAELREYYAVYILNDEPTGKDSDVAKITVSSEAH